MVPVSEAKDQLKERVHDAGTQAIREEEDVHKKRIIGTLTQRQEDLLEILECTEAKIESLYPAEKKRRSFAAKIQRICLHPVLTILLALAVLVTALLSVETLHWSYMVVFTVLLVFQSVWRLINNSKNEQKKQELHADVLLDMEGAELVVDRITGKYKTDSESLCNMFATKNMDRMQMFENEVVKIYASLYEAGLDNPEAEDFKYACSLAALLLQKLGLKTVSYSPENRKLFTVQQADYHDEMRCPAIVREKTGELVRRGEYIQKES